MDRRGFIAGGLSAFFFALFPWLRPKQEPSITVLEWGWWVNYAMWNMVRAYDLRWQIGQYMPILDETLLRAGTTGGARVMPAS